MESKIIEVSQVTEQEPLTELSLPIDAQTRLCYFSLPVSLLAQYRDQVFPLAERHGLVPVNGVDVVAPGSNYAAKIAAILRRSHAVVVDASSQSALWELGLAKGLNKSQPTLVINPPQSIAEEGVDVVLNREEGKPLSDQPDLLMSFETWFREVGDQLRPSLHDEPRRLLTLGEYRASIISAMSLLELGLRSWLEPEGSEKGAHSMNKLLERARAGELLLRGEYENVREWVMLRNFVVHTSVLPSKKQATAIVAGILRILKRLERSR